MNDLFQGVEFEEVAAQAAHILRNTPWQGYINSEPGEPQELQRALGVEDAVRRALSAAGQYDVVNPIHHAQPVSVWPAAEAAVRQLVPDADGMIKRREGMAQRHNHRLFQQLA